MLPMQAPGPKEDELLTSDWLVNAQLSAGLTSFATLNALYRFICTSTAPSLYTVVGLRFIVNSRPLLDEDGDIVVTDTDTTVTVLTVVTVAVVVRVSVVVIPHALATNTLAETSTAAMMMAAATTKAVREGWCCCCCPLDWGALRRPRSPDFTTGPA